MSYWGDVLKDENETMDLECDAPAEELLSFECKSCPDGDTELIQGSYMVRGSEEGSHDFEHKTEATKKFGGEHEVKVTATNKDKTVNWDYVPSNLNDGMNTSIGVEAKFTPKEGLGVWEGHVDLKHGGHQLGPLVPYIGLKFKSNHKKQHVLEITEDIIYEKDIHVASRTVVDAKEKKLSEAHGVLAWKNNDFGNVWLRSNCLERFVGVGWAQKLNGIDHALEASYDFKGSNNGIGGQPLFLRYGGKVPFSNNTTLFPRLNAGKTWVYSDKFEVPLQQNLTVYTQQKLDLLALFNDSKNTNWQLGFGMEFKL